MRRILVVHHSPSPQVAECVLSSLREAVSLINSDADLGVTAEVVERDPLEPVDAAELAEELVAADVVVFGTPANFGYISGALKHYFDVTFLAAHERTVGKPVLWWIRGGYDITGAAKAMRSLVTGFGMELAGEPVEFVGDVDAQRAALAELGEAAAAAALR